LRDWFLLLHIDAKLMAALECVQEFVHDAGGSGQSLFVISAR